MCFFLEVSSEETISLPVGLYIKLIKKGVPFWINLFGVVPESVISSVVFERVQKEFYLAILSKIVYKVESEKLVALMALK
jgi:hypothetical protein